MKAIIVDHISIAKEFAQALDIREQNEGYFIGSGYCITWISNSPENNRKRVFKETSLLSNSIGIKKDKSLAHKYNSSVDPNHLEVIKKILILCNSIIVATDSEEGNLFYRYIENTLQLHKPIEKMNSRSFTQKSILKTFERLPSESEFNPLFISAKMRLETNIQIKNLTIENETYPLSRVEACVLILICNKWIEQQNFKEKKYGHIQLKHRKEYVNFNSYSVDRWEHIKQGEKASKLIKKGYKAVVENIQITTQKEEAPMLFNITELQKAANIELGFSAKEVLDIVNRLYQNHFITYPRTNRRDLSENKWSDIIELVRILNMDDNFKMPISHLRFGNFNKHIVNTNSAHEHSGLLPTTKIPSALSASEKSIYRMIVFRLLESLSDHCFKQYYHVTLRVGPSEFNIKNCKIQNKGWRSIRGISSSDSGMIEDLPELKHGDELPILQINIVEKTELGPQPFAEADLLSLMENFGGCNGSDLAVGFENPFNRAFIIEELFQKKYIVQKNKRIVPTSLGLQLFQLIKNLKFLSIPQTLIYEKNFMKIEDGKLSEEEFRKSFQNSILELTNTLSEEAEKYPPILCPKCHNHPLHLNSYKVECSDSKCSFSMFRKVLGFTLSYSIIKDLVNLKSTPIVKNLENKEGKKINLRIHLQPDFTTRLEIL